MKIFQPHRKVSFDFVASMYRWIELFTFGHLLETCRFRFLSDVCGRKHALLLGDGDGRFMARLLIENPKLEAHALDSSGKMLQLLQARAFSLGAAGRVKVTQVDMLHDGFERFLSPAKYDLVVTHFFLDCFSEGELEIMFNKIVPTLAADAVWIVSEFRVPPAGPRRTAQILIRTLYAVFGLFTGLPVRSLPDYSRALTSQGFIRQNQSTSMHGILVSELWRRRAGARELQVHGDRNSARVSFHQSQQGNPAGSPAIGGAAERR